MLLLQEFGFQVTFMSPQNTSFMENYTASLQQRGIEALYSPYVHSFSDHMKDHAKRYDLIVVCRADIAAEVLPTLETYCPDTPIIFNTIDLHFLRLERNFDVSRDWKIREKAEHYKRLEPWLIENTQATVVYSGHERNLLISMGLPEHKIFVFPLLIKSLDRKPKSFSERKGLVFVGGFQHTPNVDAIQYFCREIMPKIKSIDPEIILRVAGSNTPREVLDLQSESVEILGHVEDVLPLFESARLSIGPLRFGAGLKGKVATSMACGTPVVASEIAVEGMDLEPRKHFLLAQDTSGFVEEITRAYNNEELWNSLSANATLKAEELWGYNAGVRDLSKLLAYIGLECVIPPRKEIEFF
jgi:glycosyltransferase involved in cell wall biosynthesis